MAARWAQGGGSCALRRRRAEGWFRREWNRAVDRAEGLAAGARSMLPGCIDDTAEQSALVPEQFLKTHRTWLPRGVVTGKRRHEATVGCMRFRARGLQSPGARLAPEFAGGIHAVRDSTELSA